MPLYFFHLYSAMVARDEEGQELSDADAARLVGIRSARDIASAEVMKGRLDLGYRIEIEDAGGRPVQTIHFGDAATVKT